MIVRVTMKDPDGVGNSIQDAILEEVAKLEGLDDHERQLIMNKRSEEIKKSLDKFIRWGEYIEIEFDTETGTARVIEC